MVEKFKCGFCGTGYDSVVERAQCELKCNEKHQRMVEQAAQEKLKSEKESRKESVKAAYQNFTDLRDQYIKDYREPVAFELGGAQYGPKVSSLLSKLNDFSFENPLFW